MVNDASHSEPLPAGWTACTDSQGRTFYIDHTNQVHVLLFSLPTNHSGLIWTLLLFITLSEPDGPCKVMFPIRVHFSIIYCDQTFGDQP